MMIFKYLKNILHNILLDLSCKYIIISKLYLFLKQIKSGRSYKTNSISLNKLRKLISDAQNKGQTIFIQFPIISWHNSLFQRPQQLCIGMAKVGCLTLYFTDDIINKNSIDRINDNLYITNQIEILKEVKNAIVSVYLSYPLFEIDKFLTPSFFNSNKIFVEYVDHIDEKICGKHLAKILKHRIVNLPKYLNFTFVATSKILYNELLTFTKDQKILYVPNAVDVGHYVEYPHKENDKDLLPNDLKEAINKGKKIIGYFGAIAPWLWTESIIELAEKHPEYCILLIGPLYGDLKNFPIRDNILLTGSVDYMNLPIYTKYFDASIIPFRLGDIAKGTSPLKLFEYFAIGKPIIVTSDLVECTKFDGVYSASNINEFIIKVEEALEQNSNNELKNKYLKYAHDNSWEERAKVIINYFK